MWWISLVGVEASAHRQPVPGRKVMGECRGNGMGWSGACPRLQRQINFLLINIYFKLISIRWPLKADCLPRLSGNPRGFLRRKFPVFIQREIPAGVIRPEIGPFTAAAGEYRARPDRWGRKKAGRPQVPG
jgi:hypothetical protein